jgi:hypothetical protein
MSFVPVNTYKVRSLAKPSEIVAVLSKHVQGLPIVTRLGGHKTFAGSISETGFRFVRVGDNRNSFRPTISGTFSSDSEFTIIDITIKHDAYFYVPLIIMFFLFMFPVLNSTLLPLLVALLNNNPQEIHKYLSSPYSLYLLSPFGVVFIGYFLGAAFFDSEAYLAEKDLTEILAPFIIKPETSTPRK